MVLDDFLDKNLAHLYGSFIGCLITVIALETSAAKLSSTMG